MIANQQNMQNNRSSVDNITAAAMTIMRLMLLLSAALATKVFALALAASAASTQTPLKTTHTIVVTGATGKVGSRLVRQLLNGAPEDSEGHGPTRVVALVRNATRARALFAALLPSEGEDGEGGAVPSHLEILEANFEEQSSLEAVLGDVLGGEDGAGVSAALFLACGNVPRQLDVELNVARAAAAAAPPRGDAGLFCVKLSTAAPLVRGQVPGYAAMHWRIEQELPRIFPARYAILRPNVYLQMLDPAAGGSLFGIDANADRRDGIPHALAANWRLAMIDCEDVAACAKAILLSPGRHRGREYELTGPAPSSWTEEFQTAVSLLRPLPVQKIEALENGIESLGMPPAVSERLKPFVDTLLSYKESTDHVENILGRKPASVAEYVFSNPRPFLPRSYSRLIAKGKASSFREAATVQEGCPLLGGEVDALKDDELLIRVQVAGVNGGADTFDVTRASENLKDFPLGHEGTGIVVAVGKGGGAAPFRPGDTAVFVGSGAYGEYVRVSAARCFQPASLISRKRPAWPADLTALRISGLTALVALTRTCPVQKTDVVLVTAVCGGTGHFAAQIAKDAGATVIGTVGSARKVAVAEGLGCIDRVVDLSRESLGEVLRSEFPQGVNVCYDGVGGKLLRPVVDNLADFGRLLIVGSITQYPHNKNMESHDMSELPADIMSDLFRTGKTLDLSRHRQVIGNVWGDLFASGDMATYRDRVFEMYNEGKLNVLLDPEQEFYGVGSVCDAVDHMLSRNSVGKVTVTISK